MKNKHTPYLILSLVMFTSAVAGAAYYTGKASGGVEGPNLTSSEQYSPKSGSDPWEIESSKIESIDFFVSGLVQRLETDNTDMNGWVLLAKSYSHLNRWQEANDSFKKAKALGYSGDWHPTPKSEFADPSLFSYDNTASSINFKQYKTAGDIQGSTSVVKTKSSGLKLALSLDPDLEMKLSPDTQLYIFARNAHAKGPPLAVIRKRVSDLPLEINLDNTNAMIPGMEISSADQVVVGARISITGDPVRHSGDYEQLSDPVSSDYSEAINLVIKSKIII